jgi:predicted small metal-binding protein
MVSNCSGIGKISEDQKGGNKMPSLKCKDIGMKCGFEVKDENMDELMKIITLHAKKTHNLKTIQQDLMDKVNKAIKK